MADIDEYGYVTLGDSSNVPVTSTNRTTRNEVNTNNRIIRDSWPMWLIFIATGCISGPLAAHFFAIPLINDIFGIEIPMVVGYVVMGFLGLVSGAFISHFAQEKYQLSEEGWPWLFLALCVPLLMLVATAVLTIAIALVVGIVYIIIFLAILAIGGAIAAACCGGG